MEKVTQAENFDKIEAELAKQWDFLFDEIIKIGDNNLQENTTEKIKKTEFEKIIKIYKEQGRPLESFQNILEALQNTDDNLEKLFFLYKDIFYEKDNSYSTNNRKSLQIAMEFVNLFDWPKEKITEFKTFFNKKRAAIVLPV